MRGPRKTGIIIWWAGLLHYMLPQLASALGTHLYQCTSWHCCERLCSALVKFFEDSFNSVAHFMMGDLWAHLPTPCWVSGSFWPKMAWLHAPSYLFTWSAPRVMFSLFPQLKKSPHWEMFCQCGRGETKNGRSTKRHQSRQVQKLFEQWKNI